MKTFHELNLPTALTQSLAAMKFEVPTDIQAQAIPLALKGSDLIGCAQTGTGKTAAFGIPMVAKLLSVPHKTSLVLAPTRELATQILSVLTQLSQHAPELKSSLLIGGSSMFPQVRSLSRKPRIVVATPGRLMDHLRRRTVTLANVNMLVLDESDRMLDMGFLPQLNQILGYLPKERQTLIFSATLPGNIQKLAAKFLTNPIRVSVGDSSKPVQKISQSTIQTTQAKKNEVLLDQLNLRKGSVLVFARTQSRTDRLARYLLNYGYKVNQIHGGRSQGQRNMALAGFRNGSCRILVATDVASRGIDVPHIAHVINYDLPQTPEDYIHRIGRTARAGEVGQALSILTPEDRNLWKQISRHIQTARA